MSGGTESGSMRACTRRSSAPTSSSVSVGTDRLTSASAIGPSSWCSTDAADAADRAAVQRHRVAGLRLHARATPSRCSSTIRRGGRPEVVHPGDRLLAPVAALVEVHGRADPVHLGRDGPLVGVHAQPGRAADSTRSASNAQLPAGRAPASVSLRPPVGQLAARAPAGRPRPGPATSSGGRTRRSSGAHAVRGRSGSRQRPARRTAPGDLRADDGQHAPARPWRRAARPCDRRPSWSGTPAASAARAGSVSRQTSRADVRHHGVVLDPALRGQDQRLGALALAERGEVLAGQRVQPAQPVRRRAPRCTARFDRSNTATDRAAARCSANGSP